MTRYYRLMDEMNIPLRWYLGEVICLDGSEPDLLSGRRFEGGSLTALVHQDGVALPYSATAFAVSVASVGLAEAISAIAGEDLQRLPVTIPGHAHFEVMNVVRIVKCLDERRSEYVKFTASDYRADLAGQYKSVPVLYIDPLSIPGNAHIFRVAGWPLAIIVSAPVRRAMEAVGCLGAVFIEVM